MATTSELDRFALVLAETARTWRNKLDQRLKPLGLSQAKWRVLLYLAKDGDGLMQRELAERLSVEGPTVVRLLDRMTTDGWIQRRESPSDRRVKTVHMTAKARRTVERIETIAGQLRAELFADIPRTELLACLDVLKRLKQKAENA